MRWLVVCWPLLAHAFAAPNVRLRHHRHGASPVEAPRLPAPVVAVLSAAFLNLLGFTMASPLTPKLGAHFGLEAGTRVGALTSAYPFGMLFGLLVWPHLSDRRGMRERVLVGSLAGQSVGLGMQAACLELGWPLWSFLSIRVLSGACAGASPVAKAYLADLATKDELPRWLAWREASATLAFIVGPFLGGVLYHETQSLGAVVGATATGSLLAAVLVARLVRPTARTTAAPAQNVIQTDAPTTCPLGVRLVAAVATIVAVSSLENAGSATWDAFGAITAQNRFGLGPRAVGAMLTAGACVSFAVSTALFATVVKTVGIVSTAIAGLLCIACGLLGIACADPSSLTAFVAAASLYQIGKPLYAPTLPTLLLRCVPPSKRGLAMGLDSISNTFARATAPLLLGAVLQSRGESACFAVAGSLVLTAAALAAIRGLQVQTARRFFPARTDRSE